MIKSVFLASRSARDKSVFLASRSARETWAMKQLSPIMTD